MPRASDLSTLPAPPALVAAPITAGAGGMHWRWLATALGWHSSTPVPRLGAARKACIDCLADVPEASARPLRQLLATAATLAELWHIRPEVYRVLALHTSQAEAERRLAATQRHFEAR